jgi:hypothetical protein
MRCGCYLVGLFVALALSVSALGADDKKDAAKDKPKVQPGAVLTAKLVNVEATQKSFTVQVEMPVMRAAGGYAGGAGNLQAYQALLQQQQQLMQQQIQIMQIRNPVQRMLALRQLAVQAQQQRLATPGQAGSPLQITKVPKDIDLRASDEMKVRVLELPVEFDEKGKAKKWTKKEIAERKGPDPSLPGYTGDFDSLKAGQIVKVYLVKQKPAPKPVAKGKDKVKDDDEPVEKRQEVWMVVILGEPKH